MIQGLLKPGMVFFDVGGHVGQYTLVASRLVGDAGEVHSFEPDPESFRALRGNVRLNKLKNVRLNNVALSNENKTTTFYLAATSNLGDNSLSPPDTYSGARCEVKCITLDHYLETRRIDRVDFMKVDIEGAELLMLQGAKRLFTLKRRPIIVMEFEEPRQKAFGNSCAQLADVLLKKRYDLFNLETRPLSEYYPSPNDPFTLNILAVPQEQRNSLGILTDSDVRERKAS